MRLDKDLFKKIDSFQYNLDILAVELNKELNNYSRYNPYSTQTPGNYYPAKLMGRYKAWDQEIREFWANKDPYKKYLREWDLASPVILDGYSGSRGFLIEDKKDQWNSHKRSLELLRAALLKKQEILNRLNKKGSFLTLEEDNKFYWKNSEIKLDQKGRSYKVLFFLFEKYNERDTEVVTYEEIDAYLIKMNEGCLDSRKQIKKRISDSLNRNGLLGYGKIGTTPLGSKPDFRKIIKNDRGKGFHLELRSF